MGMTANDPTWQLLKSKMGDKISPDEQPTDKEIAEAKSTKIQHSTEVLQHYKLLAVEASGASYHADPAVGNELNQCYDWNEERGAKLRASLCKTPVQRKMIVRSDDTGSNAALYTIQDRDQKLCLLSFRGTDSMYGEDFVTLLSNVGWKHIDCSGDAKKLTTAKYGKCYVGWGFLRAYLSVQDQVQKFVTDNNCGNMDMTLVVGHSLGGAMATFAAFDLGSSLDNVYSITFGSPMVAGPTFKDEYAKRVKKTIRYVEDNTENGKPDLVSTLPNALLSWSGHEYVHVVDETKLKCGGPTRVRPERTEKTAQCHFNELYAGSLENMCNVAGGAKVISQQKFCPGVLAKGLEICQDVDNYTASFEEENSL